MHFSIFLHFFVVHYKQMANVCVCIQVSIFLCLSLSLYFCLSVYLSLSFYLCLSLSISVCFYLCLSLSIHLSIFLYLSLLTLRLPGGGALWTPPPCSFLHFTTKTSPTTYDETLCKFLYHTCGNSYALIWSKNLIFAHFKASKVLRVQNRDFCTCQFRVNYVWLICR